MSLYDNEQEANREVIENLLKEIRRLSVMLYLKLSDGRFIKVNKEDFVVVSRNEVEDVRDQKQRALVDIEALLNTTETPAPAPTEEPAPQPQPEQAAPEQAPAPEQPVQPTQTEQPTQPVAPVIA